jgi:hypothetical protein
MRPSFRCSADKLSSLFDVLYAAGDPNMALKRSVQKRLTQIDALAARTTNRVRKKKERDRRDTRMMETLRRGSLPYSPAVMSWLSRQLDKRASKITPEDVEALLS